MFRFCALLTAILHDRTALPSTITVQQPHCERPQPNFGPFRPSSPRNTYSSGVLGSVSTIRDLPFTFSEIRAITIFLPRGGAGLRQRKNVNRVVSHHWCRHDVAGESERT